MSTKCMLEHDKFMYSKKKKDKIFAEFIDDLTSNKVHEPQEQFERFQEALELMVEPTNEDSDIMIPDQICAIYIANSAKINKELVPNEIVLQIDHQFINIINRRVLKIIKLFTGFEFGLFCDSLNAWLDDFAYQLECMQDIYTCKLLRNDVKDIIINDIKETNIRQCRSCNSFETFFYKYILYAKHYPVIGIAILLLVPKFMSLSDSIKNRFTMNTPQNIITDYDVLAGRMFLGNEQYDINVEYNMIRFVKLFKKTMLGGYRPVMIINCDKLADDSKYHNKFVFEKANAYTRNDITNQMEESAKGRDVIYREISKDKSFLVQNKYVVESWSALENYYQHSCNVLSHFIGNNHVFLVVMDIISGSSYSFQNMLRKQIAAFSASHNSDGTDINSSCCVLMGSPVIINYTKHKHYEVGSEVLESGCKIISAVQYMDFNNDSHMVDVLKMHPGYHKEEKICIIFVLMNVSMCITDPNLDDLDAIYRQCELLSSTFNCPVVLCLSENALSSIKSTKD